MNQEDMDPQYKKLDFETNMTPEQRMLLEDGNKKPLLLIILGCSVIALALVITLGLFYSESSPATSSASDRQLSSEAPETKDVQGIEVPSVVTRPWAENAFEGIFRYSRSNDPFLGYQFHQYEHVDNNGEGLGIVMNLKTNQFDEIAYLELFLLLGPALDDETKEAKALRDALVETVIVILCENPPETWGDMWNDLLPLDDLSREQQRDSGIWIRDYGIPINASLPFSSVLSMKFFLNGENRDALKELSIRARDKFREEVIGKNTDYLLDNFGRPSSTQDFSGEQYWYYSGLTIDTISMSIDQNIQIIIRRGRVVGVNY